MLYSKNKDALPLKTISTIKQILEKNNVLFFEYFYSNLDSPVQSLTVNLFFQNSLISVNGKGTSKDYALASAYGELMERLQNGMLFRLYNNFYYDKNEKNTNFAELKKSENLFIKEANITKRKIEKVNKLTTPALYYEEKIKNIITVPFENISEKRISYLPIKYIFSIQSTTGMCSGNTKEEALIQGICEIYERYYQQKFIANDLTYKRIKESAYEKYDDLKEIIKFLKKHNIDITIFDASEGENIPVVFAYFEDKTTNTYKIVFGCATTLAIAIERTITEYLQGISFSDIQRRKTNGINRKKTRKKIDKYLNLINSYTNNNTFLTEEQLNILNEKKYETKNNLKHFKIYENKTNKENLDLILKYTLKKVGNIYIKDASIFGFPSYYIVIPKLSLYTKYKSSSGFQNYCKCYSVIKNIGIKEFEETITPENILKAIKYSKKVKTHTTFVPCISDEYIALICSIALRKTKEIKKYINLILKKETKKTLIFEKIKILRYYYCIENNKHTRKNIEKKFGNEITNKVFNQFLTGNTFEKLIKEIKLLNLKINHKYEFEINKIRRNL